MSMMMASAICLSGQAASSRSTAAKGSSSGSMKMRPMALTTSTRAVLGVDQRGTAAGRTGGIIDRAKQLRRAFDENQRLLLVPGVIAARNHVDPGIDEFLVDRFGDAEAAGGVLAVDRDEIELPVLHEDAEALEQDGTPAASHDVADEKDAHPSHDPSHDPSLGPAVDDLALG